MKASPYRFMIVHLFAASLFVVTTSGFAQEDPKKTQAYSKNPADTSRQVIINNYYYGEPLPPTDWMGYYYPRYYYPPTFFSFSFVAPFHHPLFFRRHVFFAPRRHFMIRSFGSTRGFGGMRRFSGRRGY